MAFGHVYRVYAIPSHKHSHMFITITFIVLDFDIKSLLHVGFFVSSMYNLISMYNLV